MLNLGLFLFFFCGHNDLMKNQIELIIESREKDIGVKVGRVLPFAKRRMVGPFIFLDEMGPALLKAPNDKIDVRPHPHIGLSTLTYLFEGEMLHHDSLGSKQLIIPGEVNWMTAGKGIAHSERETEEAKKHNRSIHGLQFWVALPKEFEDVEPSFHHYEKEDIPEYKTDSLTIKLVAGISQGKQSKLKAYSPMTFMVMHAHKEGNFSHHVNDHEHALYIVKGTVTINGETYPAKKMIVFKDDSAIEVQHSIDAVFALIGGKAFPEPRFIWWNLVSSDQAKIEMAKRQWKERTFPQVPGEDDIIPLPEN